MKKDFKNHKETLYSSKGKIVYFVGKPCNIYRLRGKPYDNYDNLCTTKGDSLIFEPKICGLWSWTVSNKEQVIINGMCMIYYNSYGVYNHMQHSGVCPLEMTATAIHSKWATQELLEQL